MNELRPPQRGPIAVDLLERIKAVVGRRGWSEGAGGRRRRLVDWRGRYPGRTPLLVGPGSTAEVAEVVGLCAAGGVPIVPQGGNTSLCGGSIPSEAGDEILLSLSRMNR